MDAKRGGGTAAHESAHLNTKLDLQGTKFQAIRDDLAKEQVIKYFAEAGLSVESIGHLMGFSDVSSFRRSFKRWFGETPPNTLVEQEHLNRSRKRRCRG